jgi:hypothetical protein
VKKAARWAPFVVLVVLLGALAALRTMVWSHERPRPIPQATPTSVADLAGDPFVSPSAIPSRAPHRTGPALVGAVFGAADSTREMRLSGLPFTFVTPHSWGCLKGTVTVPAEAWRCIDEHAGAGRPQIDLVVRRCAAACTAAQRAELDTILDHPAQFKVRDAATRWAEQTVGGRYVLAVNATFADWQLLVEATAAPADAPTLQKIVNDIWAQTR